MQSKESLREPEGSFRIGKAVLGIVEKGMRLRTDQASWLIVVIDYRKI